MARVRTLILVADRNRLVAEALMDAFLEIVEADVRIATSLGRAILTAQQTQPDLVLVDAWMGRARIEDVVRQLTECAPDSIVFVMATRCDSALTQRVRLAGAGGCCEKETVPDKVKAMLELLGNRS